MLRRKWAWDALAILILIVLAGVVAMPYLLSDQPPGKANQGFAAGRNAAPVKFDADRAMGYLKQVCQIGPRISGTPGMVKQQELIENHFTKLGAKVERQKFKAKQNSRPTPIDMTNMIVSFHPDKERRILICSHYDTRPIADREADRRRWFDPFISANDGTSGVAWLKELGHHIKDMKLNVGVDFVFFDGEEYVFNAEPGAERYFFGSEYFATEYVRTRPRHRYIGGVLLDLFAGAGAKYPFEQQSIFQAGAVTREIWNIAKELNETSFVHELGPDVLDDHIALNRAGIPTVDIIDMEYKHWHLLSDTPDKVSPEQMARVAKVITTWMQRVR